MTRAAFGQRACLSVARAGMGVAYHQAESSRPSIALRLLRAQLSQK